MRGDGEVLLKSHAGKKAGRAPSQESWRVFCAIDLPDYARDHLIEHAERLQKAVPQAHTSWSRKENIHLTLKFLGGVPISDVQSLSLAAARAVEGLSTFKIYLEEAGVFPKHGPARVLWIGVKDDSGRLAELNSRLEDECLIEGFANEERPFHPHLTLARLRKPEGARALALAHKTIHFYRLEVVVSELHVIRSELSSEGSRYTAISTHPLETAVNDPI